MVEPAPSGRWFILFQPTPWSRGATVLWRYVSRDGALVLLRDQDRMPSREIVSSHGRALRLSALADAGCTRSSMRSHVLIRGSPWRTIQEASDGSLDVEILDQTRLPFAVETVRLRTCMDAVRAVRTMQVRGAPLIGVTAAYGMALALREDSSDEAMQRACQALLTARPTAVDLAWALAEVRGVVGNQPPDMRMGIAYARAREIAEAAVTAGRAIGEHGSALIRKAAAGKGGGRVNVLTHCNAGWLATVDWGTALAPIYVAQEQGLDVHVWVDETRPRNQGAALTAFELGQQGVPHTVIADNAGGHLMQHDEVDLCLVGSDRTTRTGDVGNKIGTYLKALAAKDNCVPFFAAMPESTIDWSLTDGLTQIPIERRSQSELTHVTGRTDSGDIVAVQVTASGSPAVNWGFDITPSRLVTGIVTERGVAAASEPGLLALFPERRR